MQAVWFGCDVGKYNSIKPDGILDLKAWVHCNVYFGFGVIYPYRLYNCIPVYYAFHLFSNTCIILTTWSLIFVTGSQTHKATKKTFVGYYMLIIKKIHYPDIFVCETAYCDFIMYKAILNPQTPNVIIYFSHDN